MKLADRSDVFFIAVLVMLFSMASVVFFGHAVTDGGFWIMLLSIVPAVLLFSMMRGPISGLNRLPRVVSWFALGVTAAVYIAIVGGKDFVLLDFLWCGLALAIFDLIGEQISRRDEVG